MSLEEIKHISEVLQMLFEGGRIHDDILEIICVQRTYSYQDARTDLSLKLAFLSLDPPIYCDFLSCSMRFVSILRRGVVCEANGVTQLF